MQNAPGFPADEEPLRERILKAYHEGRQGSEAARRVLDAVRQFLSGAPGADSVLGRYWFEEDPAASARSFAEDLDRASPGLARLTLEPLLAALSKEGSKPPGPIAPNLSVYISSRAGALAVKAAIDETVAGAALSAAILGLSRVGREPFDAALASRTEPSP